MGDGVSSDVKQSLRAKAENLIVSESAVRLSSSFSEAVPLEQPVENMPAAMVVERLQYFVDLKIRGPLGPIGVVQQLDAAGRIVEWDAVTARVEHNSFQFIPPEFTCSSRVAGCQKECRRGIGAHEQVRCLMQIVGIAVVESNGGSESPATRAPGRAS